MPRTIINDNTRLNGRKEEYMEFITNYMTNTEKRGILNDLTRRTFGFD